VERRRQGRKLPDKVDQVNESSNHQYSSSKGLLSGFERHDGSMPAEVFEKERKLKLGWSKSLQWRRVDDRGL